MGLFSNTTQVIRHYLASAMGDLLFGQCGTTGANTEKIYAPFLWQANDYYNDNKYEVYVYKGTNIGETRRSSDWVLDTKLLTVHAVYDAACDATSYIELHCRFTTDDYMKAINLAIESLANKYVLPIKDETTITLVADTYEYELPLTMLHIEQIITEDEAASGNFFNSAIIDARCYSIIRSYPPKLKLDKSLYSITAGKDLRIEGYGSQPKVDDDADLIALPPDWLVQKAITFLPPDRIQSGQLESTFQKAYDYLKRTPEPRSYSGATSISVSGK